MEGFTVRRTEDDIVFTKAEEIKLNKVHVVGVIERLLDVNAVDAFIKGIDQAMLDRNPDAFIKYYNRTNTVSWQQVIKRLVEVDLLSVSDLEAFGDELNMEPMTVGMNASEWSKNLGQPIIGCSFLRACQEYVKEYGG